MAGGTALIAEFFGGEERLKMIAVRGMAIELGESYFLFGGILGAHGWRLSFLLYLIAWLCLGLFVSAVPKPEKATALRFHLDEARTGYFLAFISVMPLYRLPA